MVETFITSDHHFGHNMMRFTDSMGNPTRPFSSVEEMDEALVKNFNETVRPNDKVYFLGDVVIRRQSLPILDRLNCKNRVLIRGNHDIFKLSEYQNYFTEIYGVKAFAGLIMSHIPLHPMSVPRYGVNVHGHLHQNVVLDVHGNEDARYINVCLEKTNYRPISLNEIHVIMKKRGFGLHQ